MEAYAHLKTPAQLKDEGNAAFRVGKYETAVGKYNAALVKLRKADADGLSGTLHCNAAVCLVKLGRCEEAVKAATAAADHATSNDGTRAKALVYRARAYQGSRHRPPEAAAALARVDLEAACKLQPASGPIKVELQRLVEGGAQGAASQAPQAIVKAAATAHDDADLPKALLDDAAMRGRLASTRCAR
ncbi:hypothetical protein M885DRAFT_75705 [Pelagophyceae sp. CCMP2097]|nr:hypothetical protein M885DRAFT_75705 [Pelagophyceae sp. CCMP2097]